MTTSISSRKRAACKCRLAADGGRADHSPIAGHNLFLTVTTRRISPPVDFLPRTGKVAVTISRGQVLVADGQFRGAAGHGAFLSRGLNQYLV